MGASGSAGAVFGAALGGGGLSGLYVGFGSALLRGIPSAAIVFSVYGAVFEGLSE